MRQVVCDCHTHCEHSHDSFTPAKEMIDAAIALGAQYIALTDHSDFDYLHCDPAIECEQLDFVKHVTEISALKEEYADKIYVALGVECGFSEKSALDYQVSLESFSNWDVILNSVHSTDDMDCYFPQFFADRDKRAAYGSYLRAVLASVRAPYSFDVVTHIGYVTRKAPYADTYLRYSEFPDLLDEILKAIIVRGVSLELNTHTKGTGALFLPFTEIVERYRELGGENFTYGSDAHMPLRVGDRFEEVRAYLERLGVGYLTVYKNRKPQKIKL